ncbi:MAG: hypothetical protein ABIS16_02820 [Sphingomicrobium sp.]
MNLEEVRAGFLDVLDSDLRFLEESGSFTRDDAESCMVEVMQDYDDRAPELIETVRHNLEPYLADTQSKGLRQEFENYITVRLDMLRFNLAFRAMNKQTNFCDRHALPLHEA